MAEPIVSKGQAQDGRDVGGAAFRIAPVSERRVSKEAASLQTFP